MLECTQDNITKRDLIWFYGFSSHLLVIHACGQIISSHNCVYLKHFFTTLTGKIAQATKLSLSFSLGVSCWRSSIYECETTVWRGIGAEDQEYAVHTCGNEMNCDQPLNWRKAERNNLESDTGGNAFKNLTNKIL